MSDIANKYKETKEKIAALKQEIAGTAKQAFKGLSAELFESEPGLYGFAWTQYTPYFNDGDPCYFRVQTDEPDLIFNKDGEIEKIDGYEVPYSPKTEEEIEQKRLQEVVYSFLSTFDESDFETMFGDHVQIEVTRNGIEIEEYSHD